MQKQETLLTLQNNKVVVVVRGNSFEEGYAICKASIDGGLKQIEVAYTNNAASDIIKKLCEQYDKDVCIGAGTVLDSQTARMAILAGAKYIVSPSFEPEVATMCNRYAIPYIPGCMTIKEIVNALENGVDVVKLFPASTMGMDYIKSIKAPIPHVTIMVTGGVNLTSLEAWFKAGADIVGVGGEFNKLGMTGDFEKITQIAKEYVTKATEVSQ